jgi:hypothetical protein
MASEYAQKKVKAVRNIEKATLLQNFVHSSLKNQEN